MSKLEGVEFVIPVKGDTNVYGSLQSLLEQLRDFISDKGCEHKDELLEMFDAAVDKFLALDIPNLPNMIESIVDSMLGKYAKATARRIVAKICK